MKADGVVPQSLGHLSLVSLLLSIVIVHRMAAKELGAARGLCAAALFAASPLGLGMARRALQDSFATLAALVAADVRSFRQLFLERNLYDPMSAPLLTIRGLVPGP